ncbi:MAG: hypothetical protein AAB973_03610 [Patescibacteria group bacterium]
MADLGGIPGQVASELKSLVKDIAKGTVETLTGTTPSPKADQPLAAATDLAAKRRLDEVRGELQAYYEEEKKKKEQTEQVAEEQKKMEEVQIKESKKKQEEKQVLGRLSRQYGGTAEVDKSGY